MNQAIQILENRLNLLNIKIVELEEKTSGIYKKNLEDLIRKKTEELDIHERSKPISLNEPDDDDGDNQRLQQINELREFQDLILDTIIEYDKNSRAKEKRLSYLERISGQIDNFLMQYEELLRECDLLQEESGIDIRSIVQFSVNENVLDELLFHGNYECEVCSSILRKDVEDSFNSQIEEINNEINELEHYTDKKYETYLKNQIEIKKWETLRNEILGNETINGSLIYYQKLQTNVATSVKNCKNFGG